MAKVELKKPVIDSISEVIKDAQSVVLVDYRGLTVDQDTKLRKTLREADVTYKVYKNTMMNFAFKDTDCQALCELLEGPNAIAVSKTDASEAEVMDALQNRTTDWDSSSPVATHTGRNGITLTTNANISNTETSIVNGVDDQPITKIAGTAIAAGQVAKIDIDQLTAGTYAYVYCSTVPSTNEKVYNVVSATEASTNYAKYYEVSLTGTETPIASTDDADVKIAQAGKVYFVKNVDAEGNFVSYTFKQTKVGDDVVGLVGVSIPAAKATGYTAGKFYFDVYNRNNGAYAVKVIKIVA